jgi:hypothetical protein
MGDQPSHGRTAGMVGAKNLSQEHPERHKWREDSVVPTEVDFFDDICEALCRKDLGERETTFLKKLLSQEVDLLTKSSLTEKSHLTGLLACDGSSISIINVGKPETADPFFSKRVPRKLRAIRRSDRSV